MVANLSSSVLEMNEKHVSIASVSLHVIFFPISVISLALFNSTLSTLLSVILRTFTHYCSELICVHSFQIRIYIHGHLHGVQ
ncbi:La-related protein 6A [Zea mays]|jgi:hypothetical protein|uniref:La-related protein 6A n=1 Tax=Zea mays TaxID=4577 RepID=A0A1D6NBI2_MAIZE|nr:La-related protein 6A [Zea mays]